MESTDRNELQSRLGGIAGFMAAVNGLVSLILIPAALLLVWTFVNAAVSGNLDSVFEKARTLGIAVGVLAVVGAGVWLCLGYLAVARSRPRPRAFWQASLAYNAVGGVLSVGLAVWWAIADLGSAIPAIASAFWPVAMALLSVRAMWLTDAVARADAATD